MKVRTRKLALAAYLKANNAIFLEYTEDGFSFDTQEDSRSIDDWKVDYLNSCCHRHDTELIALRNLMRKPEGITNA